MGAWESFTVIIFRVLFFPFRVVLSLLGFTMKTTAKSTLWAVKAPVKASAATARLVGFRSVFFFGSGLAIGLLFAPVTGSKLRDQLKSRLSGGGDLSDDQLADKVGFELSHAPRTWHLPQPEVAVLNGRVAIRGTVPHSAGREEIERVVSAVPGVQSVDNSLEISESGDAAADHTAS